MNKPQGVISRSMTGFMSWVDKRLPVSQFYSDHLSNYFAPKNFNLWYYFGSLALIVLVNQIITGIWLTMHYKPDAAEAFASVEYIMRDVPYGDLIRYMHSTGASLFFVVIYLHMFRGIIYGSHRKPRELIWVFGVLIFLCLMAEAFMGYVLPWGQMSFWGAQVIVNLFGAIPYIGEDLSIWIRGDYVISDATLNRFFALHVIAMPLAILALVVLHLAALHTVGSNNPDGVEIKKLKDENGNPVDGIPFHPYYTVKDTFGIGMFLMLFAFIVFFAPEMGGWFLEHDNFVEANPLQTPEHIKPVWYFTPYYAMLRAVPDKFLGVVVMGAAVMILFALPWLDKSKVRSIRYKGMIWKVMLTLFVVSFIGLGWLGAQPGSTVQTMFARGFTAFYFVFFLAMPWWTRMDKSKPEPERVTK